MTPAVLVYERPAKWRVWVSWARGPQFALTWEVGPLVVRYRWRWRMKFWAWPPRQWFVHGWMVYSVPE